MMHVRRLYIVWGLMGFTGCAKDVTQFSPTPLSDTAWVQQVPANSAVARLRDTLQIPIPADTVLLSHTDTLALGALQCILPGTGWFDGQGLVYTGAATVRARLFAKPGEWIRQFAGTLIQGVPIGADALVYLDVSVNGSALSPIDTIWFQAGGDSLWSGGYAQNTLQWNIPGGLPNTLHTGWFLFGASVPGGAATLTVTMPSGFSNANTAVFCWMPDKRVLAVLQGDYNTRSFTASGLPVDDRSTVVCITSTGSGYYLAVQPVALTGGQISVTPGPGLQTLGYITSYLEQL